MNSPLNVQTILRKFENNFEIVIFFLSLEWLTITCHVVQRAWYTLVWRPCVLSAWAVAMFMIEGILHCQGRTVDRPALCQGHHRKSEFWRPIRSLCLIGQEVKIFFFFAPFFAYILFHQLSIKFMFVTSTSCKSCSQFYPAFPPIVLTIYYKEITEMCLTGSFLMLTTLLILLIYYFRLTNTRDASPRGQ